MSKIGKSILLCVSFLLILSLVIVITTLCVFFSTAQTNNLKETAQIASGVLKYDLDARVDETEMIVNIFSSNESLITACENGDADAIKTVWNSIEKSAGIFGIFVNAQGIAIYETDNCPITEESVKSAVDSGESGIFNDSNVYMYYRTVKQMWGACIVVGYDYTDTEAVDGILSQTGSHATIFCDDTRISTTFVGDDGKRAIGTTMSDAVYEKVIKNGEIYQMETEIFGDQYMATYTPLYGPDKEIMGAYFTGCPMESVIKSKNEAVLMGVIIGVVMIIVAYIGVRVFVRKQIGIPVQIVRDMAREMEQGNLSANQQIDTSNLRKNEIGDVAKSISSALKILSSYVNDISTMMKEMSDGNFGYKSVVEYRGDFISIGESARNLSIEMKDVINSINSSADEVYNGTQMISTGSTSLADGSARQSASAEELSTSVAEITDNIQRNAENTDKAQKLSNSSIEMVNSQNAQIKDMLNAMSNIESSADEISKIIKTIEDIAFQTNILALNAAVEAARAGEAGKGFAVVADEVRNLANKSAEAASSTSQLIGNCIEAVNNGSSIAHSTAEAMKQVIEITNETNSLIENIAHQTNKQADSVQQIKLEIDSISEVIQENSSTAEESAASCEQLNAQATTLRDRISVFRV